MRQITILLFTLFVGQTFAQIKQVQDSILQVENNLIPYVPVKGFKGWNIIDRMKYYKVPGLSIAIIKDYKIDWAKSYGLADTINKTPVTTETMFSAGSISKFLMAVTALKMVDSGQIELEKPAITLRMLLSHSAGTSQTSYFGFTPTQPLPTIVEILSGAKISETRPVVVNSEPNKEFRYSGGGSMIAQLALMDVSKKSFSNLTQEIIFDKLGMNNSTFIQPVPSKFAK